MEEIARLTITRETTLREALTALDRSGAGILLLANRGGQLERTVTDGDLRRLLLNGKAMDEAIAELPALEPVTLPELSTAQEALKLMDAHKVDQVPVVDATGRVVGLFDRRDMARPILLSTPHMGDTERTFIDEAFESNWIAPLGPNVDAFEKEIAEVVDIGHAAALSSGTAALHLALRLLGVQAGDKVFCSTFTFVASANPILYQGAEPVFIDCDPVSWNMSPRALERAFEAARAEGWAPRAVVVANLYGQSADYDVLCEICERYAVPIVEDAAESLGARYKGKPSGRFGRLGVFSFNGNKIITTSGGGMLVSDDDELIERARFLSTQARDPAPHYEHSVVGYNYRMSNILAGIGRGQLQVLQDRVASRRTVFEAYRDALPEALGIEWMPEPQWSYSTRWLTTCTIDESVSGLSAQEVREALAEDLIETRPLWKPMHLQPLFEGSRYFQHDNRSVSDELFASGMCLPSGSNLSGAEVDRIVDQLAKLLSR